MAIDLKPRQSFFRMAVSHTLDATQTTRRRTPAILVGLLAVHEPPDFMVGGPFFSALALINKLYPQDCAYVVSHRATGYRILIADSKTSAIWIARRIQELTTGWKLRTLDQFAAREPELRAARNQALAEWRLLRTKKRRPAAKSEPGNRRREGR